MADSKKPLLDPLSRLSEIMFGLLMVLTFTGTLSVSLAEGGTVQEVLVGAIGCNIAWGLVDGVMSILLGYTERNQLAAQHEAIRAAAPVLARDLMRQQMPDQAAAVLGDAELDRLVQALKDQPANVSKRPLGWADLVRAVWIFLLVVVATFPPILPFVFFDQLSLAMRLSNAVAIALLFMIGYLLDRQIGSGRSRLRIVVPFVGAALVVTTIALGG